MNIFNIIKYALYPITNNRAFFINIILLIIFPTIINAYFINPDEYINISKANKFIIKVNNGASIPYILFFPFLFAYILSFISLVINSISIISSRIYKYCVYSILAILCFINLFLLLHFKTMISPTIIVLLIETTPSEISDFLGTYIITFKSAISLILSVLIISLIFLIEKANSSIIINIKNSILIFVISCYFTERSISSFNTFANLFECKTLSEIEYWYNGYRPDCNTITNFVYSLYTIKVSKIEINKAIDVTLGVPSYICANNNVNIILIIGESFCKHHSSLYGYHLRTNPLLEHERKCGNLFVFQNVISTYNMTSFVLRNLFSTNSIMDKEYWAAFPSFPILFKNSGYFVYFWDNQRTFEKADISDFSISSYLYNERIEASSYTKCNKQTYTFDEQLIDSFFHDVKLTGKRNLIIFHLMGQHTMAAKRYPHNAKFSIFTQDSIPDKEWITQKDKQYIGEYDNATLYNDYVIHKIIEKFRNDTAIIVYFPDHGEEIYDFRNQAGRTQEKVKTSNILKYQYEIPFVIWCSDQYMEMYPEKINCIKNAIDFPYMNDNICQILFNIAGMRTAYYHPSRDLISPLYKPYKYRQVQDNTIYEKVREKTK